jgi:hypothetical protein
LSAPYLSANRAQPERARPQLDQAKDDRARIRGSRGGAAFIQNLKVTDKKLDGHLSRCYSFICYFKKRTRK